MDMEPKTLTTQEVCDVLGVSLSTLRRRIKSGELKPMPKAPGQKRPYRLNFLRADVEALVQKFESEANSRGSEI